MLCRVCNQLFTAAITLLLLLLLQQQQQQSKYGENCLLHLGAKPAAMRTMLEPRMETDFHRIWVCCYCCCCCCCCCCCVMHDAVLYGQCDDIYQCACV